MKYEFDFNINDRVSLVAFEEYGRVTSIQITEADIKYQVRYFINAEVKFAFFLSEELAIIQPKN